MHSPLRLCLAFFGLVIPLIVAAAEFPAPVGRVNDFAKLLTAEQASSLAAEITAFETKRGHEFAVVTVTTLGGLSVEEYARQIGNNWGVGSGDRNDGILLLVAPNERKVRIATGPGIKGRLSDAACQRIIDGVLLPEFRSGRMGQGVLRGAQAVMAHFEPAAPQPASSPEAGQGISPGLAQAFLWFVGLVVGVLVVSGCSAAITSARDEMEEAARRSLEILGSQKKVLEGLREALATALKLGVERPQGLTDRAVSEAHDRWVSARARYNSLSSDPRPLLPWGLRRLERDYNALTDSVRPELTKLVQLRDEALLRCTRHREAVAMRDEVPGLISRLREAKDDKRLRPETRTACAGALGKLADLRSSIAAPAAPLSFWPMISARHDAATHALRAADEELALLARAPKELPGLLKQLAAQVETLDRKVRHGGRGQRELDDARAKLQQAQAQVGGGGLSATDLLVIYLLVNGALGDANAAERSIDRERAESERRSSYNSSSDYGSSSFGGGSFDGGGGASGSW